MRPSELCEHLGLPWTSVHRLVSELASQGFLEKDLESGKYRIGQTCWLVGSAYTVHHPIIELARPSLELLSLDVDGVIQLSEKAGRLALTLLSVHNPKRRNIAKSTYGYHFPLHCSSKGQVLLAYSEPAFLDWYLTQPLEQLTRETICDPAELLKVLAGIRERGYSRSEGGVLASSGALAVPVFGSPNQRVVASVSATMHRSALQDDEKVRTVAEQLRDTAERISAATGWGRQAFGAPLQAT